MALAVAATVPAVGTAAGSTGVPVEAVARRGTVPVTAVVAPAALSTVGVTAGPAAVVTSTPSVPAAPVAPTVRAVVGPVLFRFAQGVSPTAACGLALEGTARGGARLVC